MRLILQWSKLSYRDANCCNVANSVGMVPLKSLKDSDLLTNNNIRKHNATYFNIQYTILQRVQLRQHSQYSRYRSTQIVGGQPSVDNQ